MPFVLFHDFSSPITELYTAPDVNSRVNVIITIRLNRLLNKPRRCTTATFSLRHCYLLHKIRPTRFMREAIEPWIDFDADTKTIDSLAPGKHIVKFWHHLHVFQGVRLTIILIQLNTEILKRYWIFSLYSIEWYRCRRRCEDKIHNNRCIGTSYRSNIAYKWPRWNSEMCTTYKTSDQRYQTKCIAYISSVRYL